MNIKIQSRGVSKNIALLKGYPAAVRPMLADLAYTQMDNAVFKKSQQLVPVKSGELKRSGGVYKTPTGAKVTYTASYAKRIEYDPTLHHSGGKTAFFVGKPFRALKKTFRKDLKAIAVKPLK